jgi:hypothetical protein
VSEQASGKVRVDRETYLANRERHSLAELSRYGDQWVAWSADGSRVLAHDADPLRVAEQVRAAGVDSEDVVLEYIPPGGEVENLL